MHERQEGRANTEYSVSEEDLLLDLRSCQVIRSSFFNSILNKNCEVICGQDLKYLDVGKIEDIYVVALNTLYCLFGS